MHEFLWLLSIFRRETRCTHPSQEYLKASCEWWQVSGNIPLDVVVWWPVPGLGARTDDWVLWSRAAFVNHPSDLGWRRSSPWCWNLGAWSLLVERFGFDCHSKVRTGGWTWKPGLLAECCKERYLLETFQLDGSPWIGSELVVEPEQCSGKTLAFWTGSQSEKMRSLFPVVHNLYVKLESSRHKSSSRPEPEEAQPLTLETGTFQLYGL